jgi:hypothetical protein
MEWTDPALVAILVALLQLSKFIPWVEARTKILPLAALVLGIVLDGARALCWEQVPLDVTIFVHGSLIGAAAIAAYNVAVKSLAPMLSKAPPAILLVLLLPLFAGCSIPTFTRYAVAEAAASLGETRAALDESRRDLQVDRDREADLQWNAYLTDQADTLGKAIRENSTAPALKDALKILATKFRVERLAAIEKNHLRTDERFRRAEQHMDFIAHILARLDTLARREESIQEQLAEYGRMAEQVARQKFGLPPPTSGETPAAGIVALPIVPREPAALPAPDVPAGSTPR